MSNFIRASWTIHTAENKFNITGNYVLHLLIKMMFNSKVKEFVDNLVRIIKFFLNNNFLIHTMAGTVQLH